MECKKVKFISEKFAEAYIEKLQKTSARVLVPVRSYLCPVCLCWHLSSNNSHEQVKIKELQAIINDKNKLITKHEATICELRKQIKELTNKK